MRPTIYNLRSSSREAPISWMPLMNCALNFRGLSILSRVDRLRWAHLPRSTTCSVCITNRRWGTRQHRRLVEADGEDACSRLGGARGQACSDGAEPSCLFANIQTQCILRAGCGPAIGRQRAAEFQMGARVPAKLCLLSAFLIYRRRL